jgi:hypothetical protein
MSWWLKIVTLLTRAERGGYDKPFICQIIRLQTCLAIIMNMNEFALICDYD